MREFVGETFTGRIQTQDLIADEPLRLTKCVFDPASVMVLPDADTRLRVRDVELIGCQVYGGGLIGVELDNVLVDGLRVSSLPQVIGCLFRHVTLRGKIKQLIVETDMAGVYEPAPFDATVADFYADVDWALDITELDCRDLSLRGVPARLIRHDPTFAMCVTRAQAEAIGRDVLREVDFGSTAFAYTLADLFNDGLDDVLLSGPRSGKGGADNQAVIARLRDAGLGEPS